jgi:hypothetical protein
MKKAVFWDVTLCCSCKNQRFVERITIIIRVKSTPSQRNSVNVPSSPFLVTLMMEDVLRKRWLLQKPHGAIT